MKIKILTVLCGLIVVTSCNQVFDVERVGGQITKDQQWENPEFMKAYVNSFYGILPAWDRYELISGEAARGLDDFLKGLNTSEDNYPGSVWNYSAVRSINDFFANIDKGKDALSDEEYNELKGQAYFFRAYLYYRMVKVLGGVPIITTVQDPNADINTLMVKRNTSLQCFDFIELQLDSAINLLPPSWGSEDIGRITKGAAMAVKGEVLLLKASPLFCKTKNTDYWTDAYNALLSAKTDLDANDFGLYNDNTLKTTETWWYNKKEAAKEMVLYVRYNYPEKANKHQQGQRPLSLTSNAFGTANFSWEMVKAYPMKNGLDISNPNSGYDSTLFWKNRDPRFYNDVVYNGARYDFAGQPRVQWLLNGIAGEDGWKFPGYNQTGFYARKGVDTTLVQAVWNHQDFDWPIIRYAEVLLNMAEAANEIGRSSEAKDLIIQIRQRAHIDAGNGNYGLDPLVGSDYQTTLDAIMKERQIEFVLEGKRFWDLRRRRMFYVLNNIGKLHSYGPEFNKDAAASQYDIDITQSNSEIAAQITDIMLNSPSDFDRDTFIKTITNYVYEPTDVSPTAIIDIPEFYYFAPISPAYILQNENLEQTIGWDNGTFNPVIQ